MNTPRKRNHYQLLGVERDASVEQIKEAYRDIARLYHPDSNFYDEIIDVPLPEESMGMFKEITAAYTVLINDEKRKEYDDTLPPELADWDAGGDGDDDLDEKRFTNFAFGGGAAQSSKVEPTERERAARQTAHQVKSDLVGAGRVVRTEMERPAGFGVRIEDEPVEERILRSGPIGRLLSMIRDTLGGNPSLGQTLVVVLGLTLFGIGIVFILLYLMKR